MWYRNRFFHYSVTVITILLIIFLLGKVDYLFRFILKILGAVAIPVLLAGFFYYLFRPVVGWLEQIRIPELPAILLTYLVFAGLIAGLLIYFGASVGRQTGALVDDLPRLVDTVRQHGTKLLEQRSFGADLGGKVQQQLGTLLQKTVPAVTGGVLAVFEAFTGMTALLVTVPFILFYFLRDDYKFFQGLIHRLPQCYREVTELTLEAADRILFTYITGQVLLAVGQGILMYLGFWAIGLAYPLILALIIMITAFIPMFGLLIGILPALLVGMTAGFWMVVKVVGLLVIVNLLRKLVAPQLVGKRLQIHPLTIILLFLIAGALFGFFGVLVAVPAYAVLKEVIQGVTRLPQLGGSADREP